MCQLSSFIPEMGCLGSKDRLTKEDMEFLKTHTRYDEATIKEWYKGFKVSLCLNIFYQAPARNTLIRKWHHKN